MREGQTYIIPIEEQYELCVEFCKIQAFKNIEKYNKLIKEIGSRELYIKELRDMVDEKYLADIIVDTFISNKKEFKKELVDELINKICKLSNKIETENRCGATDQSYFRKYLSSLFEDTNHRGFYHFTIRKTLYKYYNV